MDPLTILYIVLGSLAGLVLLVHILATLPACCISPTYKTKPNAYLSSEYETQLCKSELPLNKFHVFGTHNSCHVAALFSVFVPFWRYTHPPFLTQLSAGLRHIEIDLWWNRSRRVWEVFHEGIDRLTNVQEDLSDVLQDIYVWSCQAHHFPLSLNLDIKGAYGGWGYKYTRYPNLKPGDEDRTPFHELEKLIQRVWTDNTRLFTSGSFISEHTPTLRAGVLAKQWPAVNQLVGKTFFTLNIYGDKIPCGDWYPITRDSIMFIRSWDAAHEKAAMFELMGQGDISRLSQMGFITHALTFLWSTNFDKQGSELRQIMSDGCHYIRVNHLQAALDQCNLTQSIASFGHASKAFAGLGDVSLSDLSTASKGLLEDHQENKYDLEYQAENYPDPKMAM